MSSLTTDQLKELTERIHGRLVEFPEMFETPVPGVVRLVYEVIEEWWNDATPQMPVKVPTPIGEVDVMDGYHIGFERGREAMRKELGILEQSGGWVGPSPAVEPTPEPVTPPLVQPSSLSVVAAADDPLRFTVQPPTAIAVNTNGHTEPSPAAVAVLGPEHTVVTPLQSTNLPSRQELIAEVKRQAMGGVMPTMAVFDMARPASWATAQAHLIRLGLTWTDLAQEAGLTLKRAK